MSRLRVSPHCSLLLLLLLSACGRATPPAAESTASGSAGGSTPASDPPADFASVAARVVGQSAGVAEGDVVSLFGSPDDLPLLEAMAIEVARRGGDPLILMGRDSLTRRMFDEVPAKYDSREPPAVARLVRMVDVMISTEFGEGRTFQGVSPERQAARAKAFQPIVAQMQKRGIRAVSLGNGLYPTAERAGQLGISREDLARSMYAGIDVDYAALGREGERVRAALAAGRELRITSPAGTDLRVPIAGRPVYVSDGVISAEDRRQGGTALSVWLPAGEVYVLPRAGGASGTLVVDRFPFQGELVEELRLEIAGGKLTGLSARSGLDALRARYEAAGSGRDLLSVVDIGINPAITVPEGSGVQVWSRAGAVTVNIGNDVWAGGSNSSDFAIAAPVSGATLAVDGTELVKDGRLVGGAEVAAR